MPTTNSVRDRGPNERDLEPHERLRLGYLTGERDDVDAERQPGMMGGVDDRFPEHPELIENIPRDFRSEDYLS